MSTLQTVVVSIIVLPPGEDQVEAATIDLSALERTKERRPRREVGSHEPAPTVVGGSSTKTVPLRPRIWESSMRALPSRHAQQTYDIRYPVPHDYGHQKAQNGQRVRDTPQSFRVNLDVS